MERMIERESEWNQFIYITNFIGQKQGSSILKQYIELMKLFRSGGIEADKLLKSLLVLFEQDTWLSQTFNELMEEEIQELKKNEVEEVEIQEDHRRVRCEIGMEEADLPIKKRSKYRVEKSGHVLKTQDLVLEIN